MLKVLSPGPVTFIPNDRISPPTIPRRKAFYTHFVGGETEVSGRRQLRSQQGRLMGGRAAVGAPAAQRELLGEPGSNPTAASEHGHCFLPSCFPSLALVLSLEGQNRSERELAKALFYSESPLTLLPPPLRSCSTSQAVQC